MSDAARIIHTDCLTFLPTLEADSFDAIVTDPPAGIAFMGKDWDHDKGGRDVWIEWMAKIAAECLRVCKPGAHALVWALPRTSHWTATAWEDAGWEVRDRCAHIVGSGFPKSLDVGKALDKAAGAERERIGRKIAADGTPVGRVNGNAHHHEGYRRPWRDKTLEDQPTAWSTAPATPAAAQWDGWGTALKPAVEDWWLLRKPLSEKTVAANVLKWGCGALNIAATRVGTSKSVPASPKRVPPSQHTVSLPGKGGTSGFDPNIGRWPANCALSHSPLCEARGVKQVKGITGGQGEHAGHGRVYGGGSGIPPQARKHYADPDGTETVPRTACAAECVCGHAWATEALGRCPECDSKATWWACPVAALDAQAGMRKSGKAAAEGHVRDRTAGQGVYGNGKGLHSKPYNAGQLIGDTGGASRFFPVFYAAKAPRAERWAYCRICNVVFRSDARARHEDHAMHCHDCNVDYAPKYAKPEPGHAGTLGNVQIGPAKYADAHKSHRTESNLVYHPTVKPLALLRWLARLVTPPDGLVLDPFAGTASVAVACLQEGFRSLSLEQDPTYHRIAAERLADGGAAELPQTEAPADAPIPMPKRTAGQLHLSFGDGLAAASS